MSTEEEHVQSTPTKRKQTPGEELYLIHLTRQKQHPYPEGVCHLQDPEEEEEDDHDYELPRKRSRSVGEELWEIYLKRSEGVEPDYDTTPHEGGDDDTTNGKGTKEKKMDRHQKVDHVMNPSGKKDIIMSDHSTSGILHLRNRDIPLH